MWTEEELDAKISDTPFTWRQALQQGYQGGYAVPTPEQMDNITKQAKALMAVYNHIGGFTVTSWLRTPEHNARVGGAPHSAHLTGLATDFIPKLIDAETAKSEIKILGIYPGGMELDSKGWVHLDLVHKTHFYK
jgi:hypothetical protein